MQKSSDEDIFKGEHKPCDIFKEIAKYEKKYQCQLIEFSI